MNAINQTAPFDHQQERYRAPDEERRVWTVRMLHASNTTSTYYVLASTGEVAVSRLVRWFEESPQPEGFDLDSFVFVARDEYGNG